MIMMCALVLFRKLGLKISKGTGKLGLRISKTTGEVIVLTVQKEIASYLVVFIMTFLFFQSAVRGTLVRKWMKEVKQSFEETFIELEKSSVLSVDWKSDSICKPKVYFIYFFKF